MNLQGTVWGSNTMEDCHRCTDRDRKKRELTTKQAAFVLRHKRDAVMILFCVSSTLIESGTSAMQHLPSILLATLHQRWIDLPIHEELWENDMNTMSIRV